jgi:hypothetical protein
LHTKDDKQEGVMNTNVQLREELFREIYPLLDNDTAIRKVLVYLRSVKPSAAGTTSAEDKQEKIKLEDLEIPAKLRRKRGCIRLTEEDMNDEHIQYILNK